MIRFSIKEYNNYLQKTNGNQSAKRTKYRNQKVYAYKSVVSDERIGELEKTEKALVFDSKKEFDRYNELRLLEKTGKITNLKRQVPLVIQEGFVYKEEKISPIVYKADFCYCLPDGQIVIEDVKGFDNETGKYITTKDFNLKWKLLKCRYPGYDFVLY